MGDGERCLLRMKIQIEGGKKERKAKKILNRKFLVRILAIYGLYTLLKKYIVNLKKRRSGKLLKL